MDKYTVKPRFIELISKLKALTDVSLSKDCISYVNDIINSCSTYIEKVIQMEAAIDTDRLVMEPNEYRTYINGLDKARKIAHDGVIANFAILNRYCQLANVPPIYTGKLDNRYEVAEFAMATIKEFFEDRKL